MQLVRHVSRHSQGRLDNALTDVKGVGMDNFVGAVITGHFCLEIEVGVTDSTSES